MSASSSSSGTANASGTNARTIGLVVFTAVGILLGALAFYRGTSTTQWEMLILLWVGASALTTYGVYLIMHSDSHTDYVHPSAWVGLVMIAVSAILLGIGCLPDAFQDKFRHIFQPYSPNAPLVSFNGNAIDIDLKDPSTGLPREADVIYVQIEMPGDTKKFDPTQIKKVRVFFREKSGENSLAAQIVK